MKRISVLLVLGVLTLSASVLSQGKFSGYMFGDYYYNVARDTGYGKNLTSNLASTGAAPGVKTMQAFQLRRVYLGYDNDISEQFTTRFRLEADQAANASNGKIGVFVKDAYLKWKNVFTGSDLIFGIQPPPAYEVSEAAWGYRSLEKTIMDLRGIVSSRDQGISLHGKVTGDGMVNYWVMVGNNSANSPETDKYKRYYAHIHVKPVTNLQATVYVDYKDVADKIVSGSAKSNATTTEALFVGYSEPFKYSVNVEAFMGSQANQFTATGATSPDALKSLGYSIFGWYTITPELNAVVRYDSYDPNTNSATNAKGDMRNYIIAGLSWKADKNVQITPNIVYESYEAPPVGATPDASLSARLTFYYIFL